MTDVLPRSAISPIRRRSAEEQASHLKSRYAADRRFKLYGLGAIGLALLMLLLLLGSIVSQG